jgi:hypothetical protein
MPHEKLENRRAKVACGTPSPRLLTPLAIIFEPVKIDRSQRGLLSIKPDFLGGVVPAKHEHWGHLNQW